MVPINLTCPHCLQHFFFEHLFHLYCDLKIHLPKMKKHKFIQRIRSWKLRKPSVCEEFHTIFKEKVATTTSVDPMTSVEDVWARLKAPLLEAAGKSCGFSKGHQWKRETWWWNDNVEDAISLKRARFKVYKSLNKANKTEEAKKAKLAYNEAKRLAKHTVWLAKSAAEKETFANISPNDSSIFKLAKQMDKTNQDVVGEKCVRNHDGELSLCDEDKMKAWVEHYSRLLNVEFEWPCDQLPEVPPKAGPPPPVTFHLQCPPKNEVW